MLWHRKSVLAVSLWTMGVLAPQMVHADISGVVYKDFDLNGQKNGGDAPVIGASIKATCDDGQVYTATSDTDGNYVLSGFPAGSKCRVEADVSSAGLGSGPNAEGSAPLVDIVADGATHNISAGSPATYCQANPDVVMAALPGYHTNGKSGSSQGGGQDQPLGYGTIFKIPNPVDGTFNGQNTIDSKRDTLAIYEQTGAIWGSAYKRGTKDLFVSAVLKRYVPLKGDDVNNAGKIYKVSNLDSANPAVADFVTIPDVLSAQAQTDLGSRDYGQNKDVDVWEKYAGRQGLGDIDISEDDAKLYAVNLNTKSLVIIDASTGNILQTVAIPNPYGADCADDMVRPWALKARGSDVFVGSVCENKVEDGVGAIIQKYDGSSFTVLARTNSLRYLRPKGYGPQNGPAGDHYKYRNWGKWNNGPMLTDIEFTNNGDLVLGYTSHSSFNRAGGLNGDIRKMCLNADGTYTDESTEIAPTNCASHEVRYDQKGKNDETYYEFYTGDFFGGELGSSGHPETASGALAQAPGAPSIIVGMVDATNWYEPGAIGLYSNTTGDKVGTQAVVKNHKVEDGGAREPFGAKAGGMGDVELLCDPAPIEIGNYVWMDINQDGLQDPNEPPMANVPVKLQCSENGSYVDYGTVSTDSEGHFYFGGKENVNLTNGKQLSANTECRLSIAKSDVNNKAATTANANSNANDTIDNDAVESGNENVITFTTTVSNDHTLDFGILPALGCTTGTLFEDVNNNGTEDAGDTTAPAGISLTLTDAYGNQYAAVTDANGEFTLEHIPAGDVTLAIDTTDTDIPDGAVWSNPPGHSVTITLNESDISGNPAACSTSDFPYTLPGAADQDPADVATCANPTSLTWKGSNKSTKTEWQNMTNAGLTATTAGGGTVGLTMSISDPDGKFYDTDTANSSGSGTSAAFGEPYLTLYLGNQAAAGDGQWDSAGNCAAHGYELEAGQKAVLTVEFDEPVVLDNWRIRDVDSGDKRGSESNWEWQDGIIATAEDADGNPVEIESKIGSSGAGLIEDANDIVHTDKDTYNAGDGDFITGAGTTPNATNGHIVLTSNFKPIKKLVITHVAGPDVPCQTRSALAMAGLAVCKPLHISGTVYDDENGAKPTSACATSDEIINGTGIGSIDGKPLNACLLDDSNVVLDTQAVANDGTYDFSSFLKPGDSYGILITTNSCEVGSSAPSGTLSEGWNYEGEQGNGSPDGDLDGYVAVEHISTSETSIDFAINKTPTALGYERPSELNPGGTNTVVFDTTGAGNDTYVSDHEEITPSVIKLTAVSGGKLYENGTELNTGDTISDFSSLTTDPDEGDAVVSFEYVTADKACRVSDPAVFKAPFTTLYISGNLFFDEIRNGKVDGNATQNSCDGTTPLYVNLIDETGKVLSSTALDSGGSYAFYYDDGIRPNTNYSVLLSQVQGTAGDDAPSAALPSGCTNLDGENIESLNPGGTDGTRDGKIAVPVETSNVTEINFAIAPPPPPGSGPAPAPSATPTPTPAPTAAPHPAPTAVPTAVPTKTPTEAADDCGCNGPIKSNGGDALGIFGMFMMMFMTLMTALFFVRKEENI